MTFLLPTFKWWMASAFAGHDVKEPAPWVSSGRERGQAPRSATISYSIKAKAGRFADLPPWKTLRPVRPQDQPIPTSQVARQDLWHRWACEGRTSPGQSGQPANAWPPLQRRAT
jgi:hypothetical protein